MTALLIALLAVLWGAVFLPTILRARQQSSPIATVGRFRRGMRALNSRAPSSGRWIVMPKRPQDDLDMYRRTIYRRRQLFTAMVFAAVGSLMLGLIPDLRWLLFVHLGIDALLALYAWWLLRQKTIAPALEQAVPVEEPAEDMYLKAGEL